QVSCEPCSSSCTAPFFHNLGTSYVPALSNPETNTSPLRTTTETAFERPELLVILFATPLVHKIALLFAPPSEFPAAYTSVPSTKISRAWVLFPSCVKVWSFPFFHTSASYTYLLRSFPIPATYTSPSETNAE